MFQNQSRRRAYYLACGLFALFVLIVFIIWITS